MRGIDMVIAVLTAAALAHVIGLVWLVILVLVL
jgi:hypothetical protein